MNASQAIEHANALFFPELVYDSGFSAMDSERQKNEEALAALRDAYATQENPGFGYDLILDLADRNRALCDQIGIERLTNARDTSLARGMSDEDLCAGIAALQHRKPATVLREVRGERTNLGVAYVTKPVRGTVLGIDIETTDRYPDRGYIVNVGFELMDLTPDAVSRTSTQRKACRLSASTTSHGLTSTARRRFAATRSCRQEFSTS